MHPRRRPYMSARMPAKGEERAEEQKPSRYRVAMSFYRRGQEEGAGMRQTPVEQKLSQYLIKIVMRGIPLVNAFRTYHVIVVVFVQLVQVWPLKKIHKSRQQLHH